MLLLAMPARSVNIYIDLPKSLSALPAHKVVILMEELFVYLRIHYLHVITKYDFSNLNKQTIKR